MIGVDGKPKPRFVEGERVLARLPGGSYAGKIRGLASENVIDMWIVELTEKLPEPSNYPWSCVIVPHTLVERLENKTMKTEVMTALKKGQS